MLENNHGVELKAAVLAALAYANIPVGLIQVLGALALLDTFAGIVLSLRLRDYSSKELMYGFFIKILMITVALSFSFLTKELGYEGGQELSEAFLKIMAVNEFFSAMTNLRGAKTKKRYKQIDLISIFFDYLKGLVLHYLKKKTETEDSKN